MEIRTIMVPLDGSGFSRRALPHALETARRSGAGLLLTYVHAGFPPAEPGEAPEALVEAGLEAETLFEEGPVAETLAARAEERADLVAMATHRRGGIRRLVLGSVADKVLRAGERPVLLHRPPAEG